MNMSKQFEFADFVDEFKVSFIELSGSSGGCYNDDGEWVANAREIEVEREGIILPLTEDDLKYAENGISTSKEKKLYTTFELAEGTKIKYKNDVYTIQSFKDYSEYADVFIYLMRWRTK